MSALVASEFAHGPTILVILALCVLFSTVVGRWWTLGLPLAVAGVAIALTPIDWYYEHTPEDVQAALVVGAACGLVASSAALLTRRFLGSWRSQ
jgi:drug/metabolite transporter (DMT)-like permease